MNKELIESKGLPYSDALRTIPTKKNCVYPAKEQIFNLFTKKYLFATLAATDYDADYFNFIYRNLNTMYNYESFFTDNDKIVLDKLLKKDSSVDTAEKSWLYEECFVLGWIMNLVDFPLQDRENNAEILNDLLFLQFDEVEKKNLPSKIFNTLYDKELKKLNFERLVLKDFDEILEKADYLKRCLWGLEELRINCQENTSGLSERVVDHQVNGFSAALQWDLTSPGV